MMIRYERDLSNAYMILPVGTGGGYRSRMILENRIQGFLPVWKRCHDDEEEYYYRVSAEISLEEYLEHAPLQTVFLKQLIFTVCRSVTALGEYLLAEDCLLLGPETIFVQGALDTGADIQFRLCLYPDGGQDVRESLHILMKYLMGKADRDEESCGRLCYELYGLLQKENFCIQEFMAVLERSASEPAVEIPEKKGWARRLVSRRAFLGNPQY